MQTDLSSINLDTRESGMKLCVDSKYLFILASFSAFLVVSCGACSLAHKHTLDDLLSHPARKPQHWAQFDCDRPIEEKIYSATSELVDMLILDNELNGFPEHPTGAALEPVFVEDLKS